MYSNVHFTYVTSSSVFMEEAGSDDDDEGEASCMYTCRANQKSPTVRPNLIFPVSLKSHSSKARWRCHANGLREPYKPAVLISWIKV